MICIECGQPNIQNLYSKYKSEYVKLTVCPACNKVCDKYIEYDSVILFLDILLLKKQAYRHLSYNLIEIDFNQNQKWYKLNLIKLVVLILLFEVYLNWAVFEKNYTKYNKFNNDEIKLFSKSIVYQYWFFILQTILKSIIFNFIVQFNLRVFYGWGSNYNYNFIEKTLVLLKTVIVSGSIKLFKILILIWLNDILLIQNIFEIIAIFNIVESLHIITNLNYFTISFNIGLGLLSSNIGINYFNKFMT